MIKYALLGDIGGTNASLCLVDFTNGIELKEKTRKSTADYDSFPALINSYLETCSSMPEAACFAAAGPVSNHRVEMTNAKLVIDAEEIKQYTPLKQAYVINDFDAIGYAINVLDPQEVKVLNPGVEKPLAPLACLGAGTGLGKSLLLYNPALRAYIPHASEGGHADFPLFSPDDFPIIQHFSRPTHEDFLSGRGLERLYHALQQAQYTEEPAQLAAKEISEKRKASPCCRETFSWFQRFFARSAKNFCLEAMATGGVYLAGGIAAANSDVFDEGFLQEFTCHHLQKFRALLRDIPVKIITNYGISLKGAAVALQQLDRQR